MSRFFGNSAQVNYNADSATTMGYFEDNDGDSIYTAGVDTLVDEYGSRLDALGVSTYVKATGSIKPRLKAAVNFSDIYDYGTTAALELKGDMTAAGQMRDCAECHVGGGAMQYVPKAGSTDLSAGTCETASANVTLCNAGTNAGKICTSTASLLADYPQYNVTSAECISGGGACVSTPFASNAGATCNASGGPTTIEEQQDAISQCGMYPNSRGPRNFQCVPNPANQRQQLRTATLTGVNSFNFFIDQYDENEDGLLGEALVQDYTKTGVLEMDCLMCHLEGYAYEERNEAVRKGKFDASRVVGAHLGHPADTNNDTIVDGNDDGKTVAYDPAVVRVSSSNTLTLGESGLHVHGMPSANCSNCHMDMHSVDWKKRGDSWGVPYEADVHGSLECVSCHSKKDAGVYAGAWRTYYDLTKFTGVGTSNILGHDPAKGKAPYSSLWDATDNSMKNCADCHFALVADNYGAKNPTPRHEALGLTSPVLQSGTTGVMDKSHIDIMDCSTCHVRKLGHGPTAADGGDTHGSLYEWGTGGAMVDLTGPDAEGRVTDHENLYVERNMENNLAMAWQGGQLIKANALVSMFWRDKDDTVVDINQDGQIGGMDQVNPSHVRDAMAKAGLGAMTADGVIDSAEVAAQRAALADYLSTDVGIAGIDPAKLQLSFMGVMFKVNHNVSPARYAWGKGGCTDCHGVSKGFYNGPYEVKPRDLTISYAASDRTPFTKVNTTEAGGVASDFHPTLFAKASQGNGLSIDLNISAGTTLRTMDLSEALWATNLKKPITTTTDGTVKATRAVFVDYLNNITGSPNVHSRHAYLGLGKCLNCHDDGAGNISFSSVSDAGQPLDKNGTVATFTYTPDPLGNPGTCSANSCHASWGFSDNNYWVRPSFTPYLSALASMDTNLQVELNASYTNCPNGCNFTFDPGDAGASMAVNGAIATVTYPAEGDYTASVIACDQVTNECRQATATASAQIVEPPVLAVDFTNTIAGKTVTLKGTNFDPSIIRAYIYWGDRKTNTVTNMASFATTGVPHTYLYAGRTYDITVKVYDASYNETVYTWNEDGDLRVVLP